jgi:hypothetical protein
LGNACSLTHSIEVWEALLKYAKDFHALVHKYLETAKKNLTVLFVPARGLWDLSILPVKQKQCF